MNINAIKAVSTSNVEILQFFAYNFLFVKTIELNWLK